MILKIERYHGLPADSSPYDWWMLDDIRKISPYVYKNHPFDKDFSDTDADIMLLDYGEYLSKIGGGQAGGRDVMRLVCRLTNGNEFSVLFDTIAYILNDNGKTIEKIVANYRD